MSAVLKLCKRGKFIADFFCWLHFLRIISDVTKCTVHLLLYHNTHSQVGGLLFLPPDAKDQVVGHFLAGRSSAEL